MSVKKGDPLRRTYVDTITKNAKEFAGEIREAMTMLATIKPAVTPNTALTYFITETWAEKDMFGPELASQFQPSNPYNYMNNGDIVRIFTFAMCAPTWPVWVFSEPVIDALLMTDIPYNLLESSKVELPFEGMYIAVPRGKFKADVMDHAMDLDGFFLAKETINDDKAPKHVQGETLLIYMIFGKDNLKSVFACATRLNFRQLNREVLENLSDKFTEANAYWDEDHTEEPIPADTIEIASHITKLVVNFLLTYKFRYLNVQKVEPTLPKSRKKQVRLQRKRSLKPYTTIHLGQRTVSAREKAEKKSQENPSTRRKTGRHLCKGHWRTYWTLDPKGEHVHGTKTRVGTDGVKKTLHKIAHWIPPHWKGHGPVQNRRAHVTI
jgi:hypothetical protein